MGWVIPVVLIGGLVFLEWSTIIYAVQRIAYSVHRDDFQEYDCATHAWQLVDYDDSHAVKYPAKQVILPARARH